MTLAVVLIAMLPGLAALIWCGILRDELAELRRSLGKTNGRLLETRAHVIPLIPEQRDGSAS